MDRLSDSQLVILSAAAAAKYGVTTAPTATKTIIIGLVRRGLIVSEPQPKGPPRLTITAAGRAAAPIDEPPPTPLALAEPGPADKPPTKVQRVVLLLRRPTGASLAELMSEAGWQAHSVRGAMSGAINKGLGLDVLLEKTDAGRRDRIIDAVVEA